VNGPLTRVILKPSVEPKSHYIHDLAIQRHIMEPDTEPEHFEFLAGYEHDPRRDIIDSLCEALGKRG
jgi:hypothetical protein